MIFNFNLDFGDSSTPSPEDSSLLYNAGYENTLVTGGWSTFAPAYNGMANAMVKDSSGVIADHSASFSNPVGCKKSPAYSPNSLEIYFKNPNTQNAVNNGAFITTNKINLTGYTKLHIQATRAESKGPTGNNHYCVLGVIDTNSSPSSVIDTPRGVYVTMSAGETVLDISSINAERYVYFGGFCRSAGTSQQPLTMDKWVDILVTKIWLTSESSGGGGGGSDPTPSVDPDPITLYNASASSSGAGNWSAFAPTYYVEGTTATRAKIKDANGNVTSVDWRSFPVGCTKRSSGLEIYFENPESSAAHNNGAFGTVSKYSLSNYSKLRITATRATSTGPTSSVSPQHRCAVGITTDKKPPTDGTSGAVFPVYTLGDLHAGVNEYNISSYTGSYYIYFGGAAISPANMTGSAKGKVDILVTKVELL